MSFSIEIKYWTPVKCDLCVFMLNNSCALDQHMKSYHETSSGTLSWTGIVSDMKFTTDGESLEHFTSEPSTEKKTKNIKKSKEVRDI